MGLGFGFGFGFGLGFGFGFGLGSATSGPMAALPKVSSTKRGLPAGTAARSAA